MKNNTPRIDRDKKTIYATKSFLIKAGQFGTTEFNTLNNALKEHPGFKVEEGEDFLCPPIEPQRPQGRAGRISPRAGGIPSPVSFRICHHW